MLNLTKIFSQIANCTEGAEGDASCLTNLPNVSANSAELTSILSVVFGVITIIAVIIIIIQGIKFVLSEGNPEKAASARKGIIYALVGLVLSLSANVIVVFVLGRL
jgi:hypothetical protein